MSALEEAGGDSGTGGQAPAPAWRQRIPGAVLIGLGLAVGLEATQFDVAFLTDPVGPKALPWLAALALVVSGIHRARRPGPPTSWPPRATLARMGLGSAALVVYALAMSRLGFFVSTTLVVAALAHLFGAPPRRGVPAAAALAVVLWLVFVRLLALPLPVGDLWMR